jgi:signal transduction histidine kinase/CheY-like chemotaxis protein
VKQLPSARVQLSRRIVVAGALLIVAFGASSAYDVWRDYRDTKESVSRELTTLSKSLAQEAARTLQSVDIVLRDTARWYEMNGDSVAPGSLQERLSAHASGLPLAGLSVRDAGGALRYSWSPAGAGTGDAVLSAEQAEHNPAASGAAADAVATSVDGVGRLILSRRVSASAGSSATVSALVDSQDFAQFYKAIDFGAGNTIALLSASGALVAREPPRPNTLGKRFPRLVARLGDADTHSELIVSSMDGERRFVALAKVRAYPFVVAVTRDENVALKGWREQTTHVTVRTIVLSLLAALLITMLVQQLARLDAAEAEKARLETQLRQSQKMEAMGTLAGGIAHDFNNILGAILGYSELAHKNATHGSTVRRYLDQVLQAAERAKRLVEGILAFSRSGVAERVPVNVQGIVEESIALLAASLPSRIRVERKLEAPEAAVLGDPTQLHQVVMNLCTNAIHAMQEGGVLTVALDAVEVREHRLVSHGTLRPAAYVRLAVSDTGMGIPPEVLERIFDPFFTTRGVGEGTGLGLSLVHGIVADVQGAVDVVTRMGKGTTFTIWLPATRESAKAAPQAARDLARGAGECIMIVDDEPALVTLAEETLAGLGYEPVGFDSSVAALQAFRAEPSRFDAVLTDETMPELAGIQLAREVRRLRPDLPVILMSGYSGVQFAERAQAAGVSEVLRKPLVSRDIADALARTLHQSSHAA